MDPDLALILGIIVVILAVPSILSAISDRRAPTAPAVIVLIGGGLILFALQTAPGGYSLDQVPDVFARVIGRYMP
ncbi:MAG: hypothetical protein P1U53_06310 [Sulfitobacter sp.]|nr:hypothetical protein [Sulfitobacter sp.]